MKWDPAQYLRFSDERSRPFHDLLSRVHAPAPAYVVDLGCGPGNLTRDLARRWPGAEVHGVDSSAEMIERARAGGDAERIRFDLADLRTWQPQRPLDVLICNATLQWVPGHLDLLDGLVGLLAPHGWLAFQVPGNSDQPSHTELAAIANQPRWRAVLAPHALPTPAVHEPDVYLQRISQLASNIDVWETTYLHVLPGDDAVLRWVAGTALRPILSVLPEAERSEFLAACGARLRLAYPPEDFGTVLPYRRIFAVCRRSA